MQHNVGKWFGIVLVCLILSPCYPGTVMAADPVTTNQAEEKVIEKWKTTTGVEFGTWGPMPNQPAPTLIILASTIQETLGSAYFRQSGNELSEAGYLLVSIDIPSHGTAMQVDEPAGLNGWADRCRRGEDFVKENNERLAQVLDYLIAEQYTDKSRIVICGTSRGGFLATHFAAFDKRVKAAVAYAPVTDLAALREFKDMEDNELAQSLSLIHQVDNLLGRPLFIVIGDRDDRVGTDTAITLALQLTRRSLEEGLNSQVDLHVISEPKGHTVPAGSTSLAAEWVKKKVESSLPADNRSGSRKVPRLR
ncbi:esterase [Polystyrenella longa]|uniref:Esterase n=1 Tax=Polystyrenella longa TaxID=2528007 RepID=A0A518CSU2_9PLAN|nr:alpha/beta fold hydrolase [Polystyrenella longa]QDU82302.1 esterase [Polystyrenella longa]